MVYSVFDISKLKKYSKTSFMFKVLLDFITLKITTGQRSLTIVTGIVTAKKLRWTVTIYLFI